VSWTTAAILAVLTLAAVGAILIILPLLSRVFAFLGSIVDEWRPTPAGQARPGHERLGLGIVFLSTPVAALLWYNVGPALVALAKGSLSEVGPLAIVLLMVVMVLTPLGGAWALLSWKNARLEFEGDKIRQTTSLGRQMAWRKVTSASVYSAGRTPRIVRFDLEHRWLLADTNWIGIRDAYESLGRAGVTIEAWQEPTGK